MLMNCSDDSLVALLDAEQINGQLQDTATHVESCAHCQTRLGQLAADESHWREAKRWLAENEATERPQHERPFVLQHPGSIMTSLSADDLAARQLLGPASHPELMGRIGRYDVERVIGNGGMGVVFKVFDSELNRPAAIKVLTPHLAGNGSARARFAREARAAAAIVNEHVVSIHNVESDQQSPFLVMQYVPGESLQGRLDRLGPLDVCQVLRIAMQTATGLAAAHQQGVVHRDVKPSNILLEQGVDRALLSDFGLARASDDASLTHSGILAGTPAYMSPEQARGEAVDPRSDLFSLGSVMYAMCTGRPPFRAETSYGVLRRITDEQPRPIREINPEVPQWLCGLIGELMEKNCTARIDNAAELATRLE